MRTSRLPRSLDALQGLRAARWVRESTGGQFDNYGPDAQRGLQDHALARYGLQDTGLEWVAARSGVTVYQSPEMAAMLTAAKAGEFDVLLVGYVSRWQRNLLRTLQLLEDVLHPAGVPILFCDDAILSSDPRHLDQLEQEAMDAGRFSRRLGRRVKEGYEAKRRRLGDPGGQPPYGYHRVDRLLEVDPHKAATVRQVYALALQGLTDREVSTEVGLGLHQVRGILTNPLYAGRLWDGTPARAGAIVDARTWETVQELRSRRRTRTPGRVIKRGYALRLACSGCGRHLFGDTGRYRHPNPVCEPFLDARPRIRGAYKNALRKLPGHSYPAAWYEGAIGLALGRLAALDAEAVTEVTEAVDQAAGADVDELAVRRVHRERELAAKRLAETRDVAAWQSTMERLDREEAQARQVTPRPAQKPGDVLRWLQDLPALWERTSPAGRQALAQAIFSRTEVLGFTEVTAEWSLEAVERGLAAALPEVIQLGAHEMSLVGARGFEPPTS